MLDGVSNSCTFKHHFCFEPCSWTQTFSLAITTYCVISSSINSSTHTPNWILHFRHPFIWEKKHLYFKPIIKRHFCFEPYCICASLIVTNPTWTHAKHLISSDNSMNPSRPFVPVNTTSDVKPPLTLSNILQPVPRSSSAEFHYMFIHLRHWYSPSDASSRHTHTGP